MVLSERVLSSIFGYKVGVTPVVAFAWEGMVSLMGHMGWLPRGCSEEDVDLNSMIRLSSLLIWVCEEFTIASKSRLFLLSNRVYWQVEPYFTQIEQGFNLSHYSKGASVNNSQRLWNRGLQRGLLTFDFRMKQLSQALWKLCRLWSDGASIDLFRGDLCKRTP